MEMSSGINIFMYPKSQNVQNLMWVNKDDRTAGSPKGQLGRFLGIKFLVTPNSAPIYDHE